MSNDKDGRSALVALLQAAEIVPAAILDAQLLGWSKSTHNKSPQITLQLAEDADIAPFELLTLAKGKIAGQILSLVVFVADGTGGETYVQAPRSTNTPSAIPAEGKQADNASGVDSERPKEGALCKLAGTFCTNPQFWFWIGQNYEGRYANEKQAADFVRLLCQVESRRDLDTDPEAEKRFHEEIRKPFALWQKEQAAKQPKPA